MKLHAKRMLAISAIYFSLNPALAATLADSTTAPAAAAVPANRIASRFESLAGSPDNAARLVAGLRSGSEIRLDGGLAEGGTSFTPATRPMGYGSISRSLALAQEYLAAQGIARPTPEQLRTALNGGTLTTIDNSGAIRTLDMPGVLQLRSQGSGWGQVAHQLGVSPGNHAAAGTSRLAPSTGIGLDPYRRHVGQGAIVSGDGSIMHGRAPGYGSVAGRSDLAQSRASAKGSSAAHIQSGRPSFVTTNSTPGIGNHGKAPVQTRGNGRF